MQKQDKLSQIAGVKAKYRKARPKRITKLSSFTVSNNNYKY